MSLVNTRIQNIRANSRLDRFELRPSRYGALNLFMDQTKDPNGIITPELTAKAKASIGNTLETPVIKYDADISVGDTRSAVITDSENTSEMVQFSFTTYSWGFTVTPAMYMNNEIGIQRDFETKMMKYIYKFASVLDQAAIAALAAAKTQVIANPLYYSFANNVLTSGWLQRENLLGDLNVIMEANDFFGQLEIVGDAGIQSMVKKLAQKDVYNIENKRNEYADKIFHFTNNIQAEDGKFAQGYAVQQGSVGMLTRFERDSLLGTRSGDGHEWGIATLPVLGMQVGTYFYDSVGDYHGIAGAATADMTRTRKEHYGFAVDVCLVTPYNSTPETIASPIIAFDVDYNSSTDKLGIVVNNVGE